MMDKLFSFVLPILLPAVTIIPIALFTHNVWLLAFTLASLAMQIRINRLSDDEMTQADFWCCTVAILGMAICLGWTLASINFA